MTNCDRPCGDCPDLQECKPEAYRKLIDDKQPGKSPALLPYLQTNGIGGHGMDK